MTFGPYHTYMNPQTLPETRVAVRKFMSEGLEELGPGGLDFLTVCVSGVLRVKGSQLSFMVVADPAGNSSVIIKYTVHPCICCCSTHWLVLLIAQVAK